MVQNSVATTDVSDDTSLARKFGGGGESIGTGQRTRGYGAPAEESEPTPYDGEAYMTQYGFDSGSETL